jgi:hypothetical protein
MAGYLIFQIGKIISEGQSSAPAGWRLALSARDISDTRPPNQ